MFARTSNEFLGLLLWRLAEREVLGLTEAQQVRLREKFADLADLTVADLERDFRDGKPLPAPDRDVFRVFQEHLDWIVEELCR